VKQLEKVINSNTAEVDWERSFYLNLIAHTSYSVTVAIFWYVSAAVMPKVACLVVNLNNASNFMQQRPFHNDLIK
jgi:hypothetical protein